MRALEWKEYLRYSLYTILLLNWNCRKLGIEKRGIENGGPAFNYTQLVLDSFTINFHDISIGQRLKQNTKFALAAEKKRAIRDDHVRTNIGKKHVFGSTEKNPPRSPVHGPISTPFHIHILCKESIYSRCLFVQSYFVQTCVGFVDHLGIHPKHDY